MTWFVWGCVVLSLVLVLISAGVLLAAVRRVTVHLCATADAKPLADVAMFPGALGRLDDAAERASELAARAGAARALLDESLRQLRSPLFYFGRLP